jgi:uncharacterized protein YecE (DUF72 family)
MKQASALAGEHELKQEDWIWTEALNNKKLRYAFEPRHPSFFSESFVKLLRKHNAALVVADTAGKWPYAEDLTADLVYIRLHGSKELYASGYDEAELDRWANRIREWRQGRQPGDAKLVSNVSDKVRKERDVFVYFDNDIKVHAPFDAINLAARLIK